MLSYRQLVSRRGLLVALGATILSAEGCGRLLQGERDAAPPAVPEPAPDPSPAPAVSPAPAPAPSPSPVVSRALDPAENRPLLELSRERRAVAITVDDGPDPRYTPAVLAALHRHGIRATFFVVGRNAAAHPSLVRAIADEGHHLANHSWSHPDLRHLPEAQVRDELQRTSELLEKATGRATTWFRAPGGDWAPVTMRVCSALGLRPMGWSVDPADWARPGTAKITSRVLGGVRPGSIVLNHDGGGDRSQTVAALRAYLPVLIDRGYAFTAPP
jgi:peptidoglycan/xylan/chitin deacetylase (PgdA/CDA1 family)